MRRLHASIAAIVGISACASAPTVVRAADAQASAPAAIEEIVVTARKRDESLISVPVVITAVSAQELNNRGISTLDGVAQIVPQLMIGPQGGGVQGGNISLRGIAGPDSNPFGDQAVSFNIDGVQIAKAYVRRMSDSDLDHIEVLKGPQALFFGKNSPAGVVSIRSADPTDHYEEWTQVGYETEAREVRGELYAAGPLTSTLGGRLSGFYSKQDGFLSDATPRSSPVAPADSRSPNSKDYGLRATLVWKPIEAFDARLKLNFGKTDNNGPASATEFIGCVSGARATGSGMPCGAGSSNSNASSGAVGAIPADSNEFGNGQNFSRQTQMLHGLELNYRPSSSLTLTSVTGYYHAVLHQCQNYENDPLVILPSCNVPTNERQFSEELRVSSDFKGQVNFAAGAYYAGTRAETGSMTYLYAFPGVFAIPGVFPGFPDLGSAINPALAGTGSPAVPYRVNNYHFEQLGKAYSAYLQLIIKPIDTLEIDLGGRQSFERKDLPVVQSAVDPTGTGLFFNPFRVDVNTPIRHRSWTDFSPEFTVSYRPSGNLTLFASSKHGFLSGGFNASSVDFTSSPTLVYDPEVIKGFEGGVKTLLLDRTLALNAAIYYYKITGLQVTSFVNATGYIRNAAGAKIKGVEADVNYVTPVQGLSVHGGAAYNKANYTNFDTAGCYVGQTAGCVGGVQNLGGAEIVRSPKLNANAGVSYDFAVGGTLKLGTSLNAMYSSSYQGDPSNAPLSVMPSYTKYDASVRLSSDANTWSVALLGKNLGNKYVWVAAPGVPFTPDRFATVSRGREVWLQASYKIVGK